MATQPNYDRLKSSRHITVWGGPTGSGAVGIADTAVPTAAAINNTGGASLMLNYSPSISWNDSDFGIQESETLNDPSYADAATYTEFGATNYGGGYSFYLPSKWDDNSNNHSLVWDQLRTPRTKIDLVVRIDGAKRTTVPAADGDFVHVFRTITDSDATAWGQPDAYRRTIGFLSQGDAEFYTIVGDHAITALPPATDPWKEGKIARLRGIVQDRDYTNKLSFRSSDPAVVQISAGGHYKVTGTSGETATITIDDDAAGTTQTVAVTVTA